MLARHILLRRPLSTTRQFRQQPSRSFCNPGSMARWGVTDIVAGAAPVSLDEIRTPAKGGGLLSGPGPLGFAAWLGVRLLNKPVRFGKIVVAARHRHVDEVLSHD